MRKKYICFEKKLFVIKYEEKRPYIEMDGEKFFISKNILKNQNQFMFAIKTAVGKDNLILSKDEIE